jgi:signal transduction histidine kinase
MIQHGGAIDVDRASTNGTVFWLRLPLAQTAEVAS